MSMVCSLIQADAETIELFLAQPEKVEEFFEQYYLSKTSTDESDLHLDRFYYSMHMAFTKWDSRNTWPYHFLQSGGTTLDIEVGYCPVRAHSAQQLEQISLMLEQFSQSELEASYVADRGNIGAEKLLELFEQLKAFVARSVTSNKNVLVFIT